MRISRRSFFKRVGMVAALVVVAPDVEQNRQATVEEHPAPKDRNVGRVVSNNLPKRYGAVSEKRVWYTGTLKWVGTSTHTLANNVEAEFTTVV